MGPAKATDGRGWLAIRLTWPSRPSRCGSCCYLRLGLSVVNQHSKLYANRRDLAGEMDVGHIRRQRLLFQDQQAAQFVDFVPELGGLLEL